MTNKDGLSRRDFLKRGAALGGALVWVTPVVQVVGMRPAFAQTVSPVCGDYHAIKIEIDEQGAFLPCEDIAGQIDPNGQGQCLDVDAMGVVPVLGGCPFVTSTAFISGMKWVVQLASDCEFQIGQAELKTGTDGCVVSGVFDPVLRTVTFDTGAMGQDISNVQFVFCKLV